jgi:hypothetical protein
MVIQLITTPMLVAINRLFSINVFLVKNSFKKSLVIGTRTITQTGIQKIATFHWSVFPFKLDLGPMNDVGQFRPPYQG